MAPEITSLYGVLLMLALGIRHGLDPDHIAIIDAMAYRCLERRPAVAPWVGTLFALGHGLTVTALAVLLSVITADFALAPAVIALLDWMPVLLLFGVGSCNLHALLASGPYTPRGWKQHAMPKRLQRSEHPVSIFMVGVLFALVFDTATHAAAWGSVASGQAGWPMALVVGLAFTAGMALTDTLDGRMVCRLMRQCDAAGVQRYRRRVGWTVVALAYGVVGYSVASHLYPPMALNDASLSGAGVAMVALLLLAYLRSRRQGQRLRRSCP